MNISEQIEWIRRLVAFDTTSALSNLALIEDVEAYLAGLGVKTCRVPSDNGKKSNLFAVVGPEVAGGIVLSGHTDVVPVTDQKWDSDPFEVIEKEGKLYGRGTCDMKSFSAIALSLVPKMLKAGLKKPIILAFSYDEETGCFGAPRMIARILKDIPRPAAVIVGEPTMMKVVTGHKGISGVEVSVRGYITHSSQPQRGVSAVMVAAKLITYIEQLAEVLASKAGPSPFVPPHTTMTVNLINGGVISNIMAGACDFVFDIRTVPGDKAADLLGKIQQYATELEAQMQRKHPDCSITLTQLSDVPPLTPVDHSVASELAQSLTGQNQCTAVAYAAEAGQFQNAGLPTIICGPGSIDQAHQPNEYISLAQVAQGTQFIERLIKHLAM